MICKSNSIVIIFVVIVNFTLISSMNSDQKIQPRSGVLVTFRPSTPEPEKFYINRRNFEVNFDLTTFEFFQKLYVCKIILLFNIISMYISP